MVVNNSGLSHNLVCERSQEPFNCVCVQVGVCVRACVWGCTCALMIVKAGGDFLEEHRAVLGNGMISDTGAVTLASQNSAYN